jgi:uncharacterized protein YecE (DUF72 family)
MAPPPSPPLLRVGCPMWANRAWVGRWFPVDTPTGQELSTYASWCNTVEGNTTFYATPPAETIARWLDQAPDHFRFCFKLPQEITHQRRLRASGDVLTDFLDRIEPLLPHLGPLQVQLPASFEPDDISVLDTFLSGLPASFGWAVEVRHPDFFVGGQSERPLNDLLAARGVNRVTLDSRALFKGHPTTSAEKEAWENKPRLAVRPVATGTQPLVRLIGQSDTEASMAEWEPWIGKLAEWVQAGLEPHVFAHTPDNADAPDLARRLWSRVRRLVPELAPLPVPALRTGVEQLDMFPGTDAKRNPGRDEGAAETAAPSVEEWLR